jgi:hypothetical protein
LTQLSLNLDDLPLNPLTRQRATNERVGIHLFCALHETWVECQTSHCGESPMCAYEEPDNSDAAMRARLEWLAAQKEV